MAGTLLPPESPKPITNWQASAPAEVEQQPAGMPWVEDTGAGGIPWKRYIAALKRYKWLIAAVTILGTGLAVASTRYLTPSYEVRASIWIAGTPEERGPIRAGELLPNAGWQELLTQFAVLDSVTAKERLYLNVATPTDTVVFRDFQIQTQFKPGAYKLQTFGNGATYRLSTLKGEVVEEGAIGEPIGAGIGFSWHPTRDAIRGDRTIKFSVLTPRDASERLKQDLSATLAQNGSFLAITLEGSDPARITRTVNELVDDFVRVAADLKRHKLVETSRALREQMDSIGSQLREAERKLEAYKTSVITLPNENTPISSGIALTQPTVTTQYFQQKMQIEDLKRDRERIDAVLLRAKAGALALDEFQTIPSVKAAPDLNKALGELSSAEAEKRSLLYRYLPESRQVQQVQERIDLLRSQTIPAYAQALSNALADQQRRLEGQVSATGRDMQQMPVRAITEARFIREAQTLATIYADVQGRYESAKLAEASAVPDVRVLDHAVQPTQPAKNSASRIIAVGFVLSGLLALGLAVLLDLLDKRFRYPEQVTRELGLAILGAVPAIKKGAADRDPDEANQVVESFRTIRLNLAHSYGAAGPVLLTISSPSPGDGKSLVSSNLALSFAEAGYATLLVDGDIRRGELHRMFGTDRRPGLLDYLVGTSPMEEIARPTTHKNLTLIPCGTRLQHGPELLGSNAMRELMASLKTRYAVIIVDSPPLGAGIDPFVLGTATGNLMLVLRSGETDRQLAEAKLKLLDRLPVRQLGAVLNDVNTTANEYKYYSYIYGYTADEPSAPQLARESGKL